MTFRGRHRAVYITKYQPMYIVNPVFCQAGGFYKALLERSLTTASVLFIIPAMNCFSFFPFMITDESGEGITTDIPVTTCPVPNKV